MIYLDLNVLADFNGAAAKVFGLDTEKPILDFAMIYESTGLSLEDFFERLDREPNFWATLPITRHAFELFDLLTEVDPEWTLITSATERPECWSGKFKWVQDHLRRPGIRRLSICLHDIGRRGHKGDIMIAENRRSSTDWFGNGGLWFFWVPYRGDGSDIRHKAQMERLMSWIKNET